jgi:hypothetical protein
MNPADPAIFQPDLDSPRVKGGAGEDVFDDSFGKLPGSLVLFQNYRDCKSGMDILSVLSFHNYFLFSFHPETVFFRPGGVNLRGYLCGVPVYASAQPLDFLARTKKSSFPN